MKYFECNKIFLNCFYQKIASKNLNKCKNKYLSYFLVKTAFKNLVPLKRYFKNSLNSQKSLCYNMIFLCNKVSPFFLKYDQYTTNTNKKYQKVFPLLFITELC